MKKILISIAVALAAATTADAGNYRYEWKESNEPSLAIIGEGYYTPDGIICFKAEKGTSETAPVISGSGLKLCQGSYISVKAQPGYSITYIHAYGGFRSTTLNIGTWENDPLNSLNGNEQRWVPGEASNVTELIITPTSFNSSGIATLYSEFVVGYTRDGASVDPQGHYLPYGSYKPSYTPSAYHTQMFPFAQPDDGTVIRYVVYDYTEGMEEPDVDETSAVYTPATPLLRQVESGGVNGKVVRFAARAYTPGKEPSDIVRSAPLKLRPDVKRSSELAAAKKKDSKPLYSGNATIYAIAPGYNSAGERSEIDNLYFLRDEDGSFKFDADGRSKAGLEWLGFKEGDVVTDFFGDLYLSERGLILPNFTNIQFSGITLAPAHTVETEALTVERVECTPAEFKDLPLGTPVVIRNIENLSTWSGNSRLCLGTSFSNSVDGILAGPDKFSKRPDDWKIPSGQTINVYGVKTQQSQMYLTSWEKVLRPAKKPRFFPLVNIDDTTVTVPANQMVFLTARDNNVKTYYTIDGTDPDESSTLYTGPFILPADQETVVVKARSYGEDFLAGEILKITVTRNDYVAANFNFTIPEELTPAVNNLSATNTTVSLGETTTFTTSYGEVKATITLDAPADKEITMVYDEEGSYISLPVGTHIKVASTHSLRFIKFKELAKSVSNKLTVDEDAPYTPQITSYDVIVKFIGGQRSDDETHMVTEMGMTTTKEELHFMMIEVAANPDLFPSAKVNSFPEVQVLDDNYPVYFANNVYVSYVSGDEAYILDNPNPKRANAMLMKFGDRTSCEAGSVFKRLRGEMATDTETGVRYFKAQNKAYETTEGNVPQAIETTLNTLSSHVWKVVKISDVKAEGEDPAIIITDHDNYYISLDNHFGTEPMPTGRRCDAIGIVRSGRNGLNFAPVSFERLDIAVEGITLDKSTAMLTEGETLQLTATVIPTDATDTSVTWSSSDPTIASVSDSGEVLATGMGTAIITATAAEGHTASCTIIVSALTGIDAIPIGFQGSSIRVYNIMGKHIRTIENCSGVHELNLPAGVYILRPDNSTEAFKVLVK